MDGTFLVQPNLLLVLTIIFADPQPGYSSHSLRVLLRLSQVESRPFHPPALLDNGLRM